MRRPVAALIAVLVLVVASTATTDAQLVRRTFIAPASGSQEVPAVDTDARGLGIFRVSRDGGSMHFAVIANRIDDVIMAHLHIGAPGTNGPIAVWLYPDEPPPALIPGTFQGVLASGVLTDDHVIAASGVASLDELVDEIRAGNVYLNIHTLDNPAGEVRGQLR
jgi:hypothetical protein